MDWSLVLVSQGIETTIENPENGAEWGLLVGKDVAIYSENNTGVGYKLGYTAGVNGCGAVFFGLFFWRLRRLKKWAAGRNSQSGQPQPKGT